MVEIGNKKLAIFLPTLMGGGAEKVMVTLANEFIERGVDVDLVLAKAEGPYLSEINQRIRVVDLNSKRQFFCLIPLLKYLRKERPSVMLSALSTANIVAVVARLLSRTSFRLVISERAVSSIALKDNRSYQSRVLPFLMRIAYPMADAVIAVAHGVADDLIQNFNVNPVRVKVVYNPVVTAELLDLSKNRFEHESFDGPDISVVLSVGRLTSQKNFNLLIRAFAELTNKRNLCLVILGEGELRQDLEGLAKELGIASKVYFPGFVLNPFMWMRRASVFVLSSDYEGLPGALIQAMACGTPVVSTNCPSGPSEILEDGKWGRLVAVNDSKALSKAIMETLKEKTPPDVKLRAQYFDVKHGADGYQKLLQV